MSEENKLNSMADGELDDVVGGWGYIVEKGGGDYEYWFSCPACCGYKEMISSGNTSMRTRMNGRFVCKNCGWSHDFSLNVG
jgi:transcription elongation factor Elf1